MRKQRTNSITMESMSASFKRSIALQTRNLIRLQTQRMSAMFKDYVTLRADELIHDEDLDLYHAPSECSVLVEKAFRRNVANLESKYGITEDQLTDFWTWPLIERTVGRVHLNRCPFCKS